MKSTSQTLGAYAEQVLDCRRCPDVQAPPVLRPVPDARIYLMGQAPGPREREEGRPFVWTAGTTLFRWFASIGVTEEVFRQRVYMAAVIRCFPGKLPNQSGDRRPAAREVANCRPHWQAEVALLQPRLVLPVGRMAIETFLPCLRLEDVVGQNHRLNHPTPDGETLPLEVIPLPHPSGLSRWHRQEPGRSLLERALALIADHPAWRKTFEVG